MSVNFGPQRTDTPFNEVVLEEIVEDAAVVGSLTTVGSGSSFSPTPLAKAASAAGAGVVNDVIYFPFPSGGDDTALLNSIIAIANAREFRFQPNANYSISAGLTPSASGQRFYIPLSTTITQATWGLPWFEVRNFTDVEIDCRGLLTSTQPRSQILGPAYDGTGARIRCAGVYGYQCDRLRIPFIRVNNAVAGVTLRGNTDNVTLTNDVQIGRIIVSNCDWGLLYGQQRGMHVQEVRGAVAFSQDFPHLIYSTAVAPTGKSQDCVIESAICTGTGLVQTSSANAVNSGAAVTITPASMANIVPAMSLYLDYDGAHGTKETIVVISVDTVGGTFTANVAGNHTAGVAIGTDNHAFSIKDQQGLVGGRWIADGCGGLLTTDDMTDCVFTQLLGWNLTGLTGSGSIFGQASIGTCDRNRFGIVHLEITANFPQEPAITWGTGASNTDNTFDDVFVQISTSASGGDVVTMRGTRNRIESLKVVSTGAGHPRGVGFPQGSGHKLSGLETVGCQYGFEVNGATGVQIDFLPDSQDTTNLIAPGVVSSGSALIKTRSTRFTQAFSGGGRTPDLTVGDYITYTVSSNAAWTINNPINATDGAELTIELANTSAGAIATPGYGAAFAHAGGVAPSPPGTGKSRVTNYRYNATKALWIETYRSSADL